MIDAVLKPLIWVYGKWFVDRRMRKGEAAMPRQLSGEQFVSCFRVFVAHLD